MEATPLFTVRQCCVQPDCQPSQRLRCSCRGPRASGGAAGGRAGGPTNGANGWSDSARQARSSRVSSAIKPIRGEHAPSRAAQAARQAQRGADLPGRRTGPASCAAGLAPAQRQARDARQPECRVRLPSERPASALPVTAGDCDAPQATSNQASGVARQTVWRFAWRACGAGSASTSAR